MDNAFTLFLVSETYQLYSATWGRTIKKGLESLKIQTLRFGGGAGS